jgi:hypothetical protein
VDDLLLVFDSHIINIHNVLQDFNTANPTLCFTLEEENDKLNFLDIIIRDIDSIHFNIYRKPTVTDTIIPADSCHPSEHKQSAIKFLKHRNSTYPTTPENKLQEETVIKHILHANQYNTSTANRTTNNHNCEHETKKPNKWAKFTYVGREVHAVTNLFRHTNVGVTFNTADNTECILSPTHHQQQSDRYSKSGVYALTCSQCQKQYIGQTGRVIPHPLQRTHAGLQP